MVLIGDKLIDLTGEKFGRLMVLKRAKNYVSPKGQQIAQWLCKCDCGNEVVVMGTSLRKGASKSCGCLNKELLSKRRKKNDYDLSKEYGIGYTSKGEEFYFDLEDYNLIKDYNWHIDAEGYVCTNIYRDNTKTHIKLHRLVMKCNDSKLDIDHINHIKYDNKKSNLRIVTRCQNNMNMSKRKDNTSGVTGVVWYKTKNKWRAQIMVDKKNISLGYYKNFEDAVRVRKEAEEKYFGEYSYDNSMALD